MEKNELSKTLGKKVKKMTLNDYYHSLPDAAYPKTEFVNKVAVACKVSTASVRNWIAYGIKPCNEQNVKILEEMTGIPASELWSN